LGFYLPAFQHSFRKRLSQKPKFYFIDVGITRALARTLTSELQSQTYVYGDLFEHFIILECYKLAHYFFPDYRFSYLRTHDDLEIDLVIERPDKPLLLIEIKSANTIREDHVSVLQKLALELGGRVETICFAQVTRALKFDRVTVYP
jgi:predicted AAA+ superfamily ATPase